VKQHPMRAARAATRAQKNRDPDTPRSCRLMESMAIPRSPLLGGRGWAAVLVIAAFLPLGAPRWAQAGPRPSSAAPRAPHVKAQLAGPYRWVRVDQDQNGQADALRLEGFVRLDAGRGDSVDVDLGGWLHAGSQFITSQPGDHYAADHSIRRIGRFGAGLHPFAYDFSGEAIRRSGLDGPYRAKLTLWVGYPNLADTTDALSPSFRCREFGELPYRLTSATEHAEDRDGDGLYDAIVVEARVDSPNRQPIQVRAMLSAPGAPVEFGESNGDATVEPGVSVVSVRIEGSTICRGRVDGPYDIEVDVLGTSSDETSRKLRTRPYRWRSFVPPDLELRPGRTRAVDVPGRYPGDRRLEVEIPVKVHRAGEFQCSGSIASKGTHHAGFFNGRLEAGARTLRLAFGSAPWDPPHPTPVLECRCFRGADLRQFEDFEFVPGTTITAADLAPDRAPNLELTGSCLARPVDIDGNGDFELLEFAIPTLSRRAGAVSWQASLVDPNHSIIDDAHDWVNVPAGPCTLRVRFDGPTIHSIGVDGAYRLWGFVARRPSVWGKASPGVSLRGDDCGVTVRARDFARPAHIVGRVLKRDRPVHPAMIVAERSTPSYAMADSSGRFALPVPRPVGGKIHLRLKPTPGEGLSGWRVVMGGKTIGTNGEADIPVTRPEDVRVDFVHD
jgi:hypothetical protein